MSLKDLSNLGVAESLGLAGPLISNPNTTAATTAFATSTGGSLSANTLYQLITLDPVQASVVGAWYRLNFYLETTSVTSNNLSGSGPFRVYATYNNGSNSVQAGQSSQMVIAAASTAQASRYSFTGTLVFQAIDPTTNGLSFGINVDHQITANGAPTGTSVKLSGLMYNVTNLTLQRIGYGPAPSTNVMIKTFNT